MSDDLYDDPRCAKCGHPRSNHPYRHPFEGPQKDDTIKTQADRIEELKRRLKSAEERAEVLEELVMDVVADLREGVSASKIDYRIGKVMQKLEWEE